MVMMDGGIHLACRNQLQQRFHSASSHWAGAIYPFRVLTATVFNIIKHYYYQHTASGAVLLWLNGDIIAMHVALSFIIRI